MARAAKGRNNGVTIYKRTLHTNMRQSGRGINRGGIEGKPLGKKNVLGRRVSGRESEARKGFTDFGVKIRKGR